MILRSGLRTLVVAKRPLSAAELEAFDRAYHTAKMSISDRSQNMQNCVNRMLEKDLQLLCLTGVEDRLQVRFLLDSLKSSREPEKYSFPKMKEET